MGASRTVAEVRGALAPSLEARWPGAGTGPGARAAVISAGSMSCGRVRRPTVA